jgi:hypothetical protein
MWDHYRDDRGVPVVRLEIEAAGRSLQERAMIQAEVGRLMRAAREGRLKPYLELKHIRRNRLIYELRLSFGGDGYVPLQLWRLYFAWHSNRGPLRLALKFGWKPADSTGTAVQDTHIDEAGNRYRVWLAREQAR